jgi:hypothetical protein
MWIQAGHAGLLTPPAASAAARSGLVANECENPGVLLKIGYLLTCRVLGLAVLVFR